MGLTLSINIRMTKLHYFRICLLIVLGNFLISCSNSENKSKGYIDGYFSGYNTMCLIKKREFTGIWDDQDYVHEYNRGYYQGHHDCDKKLPNQHINDKNKYL